MAQTDRRKIMSILPINKIKRCSFPYGYDSDTEKRGWRIETLWITLDAKIYVLADKYDVPIFGERQIYSTSYMLVDCWSDYTFLEIAFHVFRIISMEVYLKRIIHKKLFEV